MKLTIILAAVLCLMAITGSGTTVSAEEEVLLSFQQTGNQVELYVTSWCPYCRQAMDFFRSRGIYYVVYDIEKDDSAARRKQELDPRRGVPFAVINGVKIHGFSEEAYLKALNHN